MKFKKVIMLVATLIGVGTIGNFINTPSNVQAKQTQAVFPKSWSGTWYSYNSKTKKIDKMTFTKTKQIYYENGHQYPKLLKAKPKVMPKPSKKTRSWVYLSNKMTQKGYTWTGVGIWGYPDEGTLDWYNVAKLDGNKVLGYAEYQNVYWYVDSHWYQTAKLAKKLKDHKYPNYDFIIGGDDL